MIGLHVLVGRIHRPPPRVCVFATVIIVHTGLINLHMRLLSLRDDFTVYILRMLCVIVQQGPNLAKKYYNLIDQQTSSFLRIHM